MTVTSTALRRAAATLAFAALVLGCSAGSPGSTAPASASAAVPSIAPSSGATATAQSVVVPAALVGTWMADVEGTTSTSGSWVLKAEPGNLSLKNPKGSEFFPLAPTLVTDHEIVLPADSECPDQTAVTEGRYTYALTGSGLVITRVSDSCGDRAGTLTAAAWTKQP